MGCPGHRCPIRPLYGQCLFWNPPLGGCINTTSRSVSIPHQDPCSSCFLSPFLSQVLGLHCGLKLFLSNPVLPPPLCLTGITHQYSSCILLSVSYLLPREAQRHMHHKKVNNDISDVLDFFLHKNPLLFCLQYYPKALFQVT